MEMRLTRYRKIGLKLERTDPEINFGCFTKGIILLGDLGPQGAQKLKIFSSNFSFFNDETYKNLVLVHNL